MPEKKPRKKVPSAGRAGAGSKKTTARQRRAKRPPPAPKSGKRPVGPAVLAAARRALALPQLLALPELPQPDPGQAINLGPIAGTESPTGALGAGAVDLCEISPSGQVALGGDTFSGNAAPAPAPAPGSFVGTWSPSMALQVQPGTLNANTIQFNRSFGQNGTLYAEPPPPPSVPGGSQLPAGTVQVFGTDYAFVARTTNLQPIDTRLVQIDPNNPGWPTVPGSWRDAESWQDGNETQISGYQAPDGWVHIVADGFARDHTVRLYHCHAESFTDRNTWWAWGIGDDGNWAWNVDPTPLSGDLWGELSLRLIEGMSVLSGFNASTGRVEVRVADDVTQVLAPGTPMTVVADQFSVPQNYGGYIVPGSTLDQAIILVSQFNTMTGDPYNVQQFVVNLNR
jgi:D-arabinan endo alpha-(1,5)-arabinofuranosidase